MIEGKGSYDKIMIPDQLDTVLTSACMRAKRQRRRDRGTRYGLTAAAFLSLFVLCNNEIVYAKTVGIPVIGTLVQLLHVGEGGNVTDGVKGQFAVENNILSVEFSAENLKEVPHYQIEYHTMPRRIVVTIDGIRGFDRNNLMELANQCTGIGELYFLTVLDDSRIRFVAELQDGIGYQVAEYQDPASLKLTFGTEYYVADGTEQLWTVRIPAMESGEPLAMVQELYAGETLELEDAMVKADDIQTVKTQSGLFTLTAGAYSSKEEAQSVADYLNQMQFSDKTWFPEQQTITRRPK